MSSAEGTSAEEPQAPRGLGFGEGVSPPQYGMGLGRGLYPSPELFFNFLPRNAFFEHFDTIRQFTRPVAIRLKACKKRRHPCQRQVLVVFH